MLIPYSIFALIYAYRQITQHLTVSNCLMKIGKLTHLINTSVSSRDWLKQHDVANNLAQGSVLRCSVFYSFAPCSGVCQVPQMRASWALVMKHVEGGILKGSKSMWKVRHRDTLLALVSQMSFLIQIVPHRSLAWAALQESLVHSLHSEPF